MTKQADILQNANYLPRLDYGFVGVVDHMGNDAAIVQAARVSYGAGTKTVNEDRGLIRYLLRHQHTTPFEMCEIKLHVRAPIFVARQWVRHRTSATNEVSFRYSEMDDEFYMPDPENIQKQSLDNKQGRSGALSKNNVDGVQWLIRAANEHSFEVYNTLLGKREDASYEAFSGEGSLLDDEFPENGIARELARTVMPVSSYTEFYWKVNLLNLFKFLHLRSDQHAQYEIRVYAEAIIQLVSPLFPEAFEAANDYMFKASHLSRMDMTLVKDAISDGDGLKGLRQKFDNNDKLMAAHYNMNLREMRELFLKLEG